MAKGVTFERKTAVRVGNATVRSEGESRVTPLGAKNLRHPRRGGDRVSIILGQTTAAVAAVDSTFNVDNIDLVTGVDPRSDTASTTETVQIKNTFGQVYANNEKVIAFQRADNDAWEVEKVGAGSSQLIHFELTQDKGTADVAKLARTVKQDGTLDLVGSDFYVLDNSARYYGKAAWSVVGPPASSDRGYRGYAEFRESDYNATGKAGYDIVEMEQPVMGYLAKLTEDSPPTNPKTFDIDRTGIVELEQQGEGRAPKGLLDTLSPFIATDTKGMTTDGTIDVALIVWSVEEDGYIVAAVPGGTSEPSRIKGQATSAVTSATATFAIDNITLLSGKDPRADPLSATETVTVKNDPAIDVANNDIVFAAHDLSAGTDDSDQWTTSDLANWEPLFHAQVDYDGTVQQVLTHKTNEEVQWLPTSLLNPPP